MSCRVCKRVCDEAQEQQRVDGAAERRGRLRGMHHEADVSQRKACLGGTCCKCSCSKQEQARLMNACQLPLLALLEEVGRGDGVRLYGRVRSAPAPNSRTHTPVRQLQRCLPQMLLKLG